MNDLRAQLSTALAGRYAIERELGRGGMATVFRARDLKHGRTVALKVLDPELASALGPERFLREIRIAAQMQHQNIVPLYDSGEAGGLLFYVMPCIEGGSLRARLEREKQLSVEDALRIAGEVAGALAHAHGQGVVHRDIKPENVLFDGERAVVTDFGIARAVHEAGGETLTATGVTVGTPSYMSPEQASGGVVEARSDQYALACVVYEMLAGQPPFTGPTAESVAHQHLAVTPRPVTELRPAVKAGVAKVVGRGLAKAPADRYASVARFAAALREAAEAGEVRPWRRWALVTAAAAVLAVGGWWIVRPPTPAKPEWIVLADFEGPAGDPRLGDAVRELIGADLDQSSTLRTVPREQLRIGLTLAGKPDSMPIVEEVARELAQRNSIGWVLSGRVMRIGVRYSVVTRAITAETGESIVSLQRAARSKDDLIPAAHWLAQQLARRMSGRAGGFAPGPNIFRVGSITPIQSATRSMEAYRKYLEALNLHNSSRDREAIRVAREALAIDPEYVGPLLILRGSYINLGVLDSARLATREVGKRAAQFTGTQRMKLDADMALASMDLDRASDILERAVERDPANRYLVNSLAFTRWNQGRFEEAARGFARSGSLWAIGPSYTDRYGVFLSLTPLGRFAEAEVAAESLHTHPYRYQAELELALSAERWPRAESLATVLAGMPSPDPRAAALAATVRAAVLAVRGAVRDSRQALRIAETSAAGAGILSWVQQARRLDFWLDTQVPSSQPAWWTEDSGDTTVPNLVTLGMSRAAAGDISGARSILRGIQGRPEEVLRVYGAAPALLAAWLDRSTGRWTEVVDRLRPLCSWGGQVGTLTQEDGPGRVLCRWLVAEAFERLGQADSAVVYYKAAISPDRLYWEERVQRTFILPFAHQRLAVLQAGLGRRGEALRHFATLERLCAQPDPAVRDLIVAARRAVSVAGGTRGV